MRLQHKFVSFILSLSCAASASGAGIELPAGASWVQPGQLDLGGSNLLIGGNFTLANGSLTGGEALSITSGGIFEAGSGGIQLFGDWTNNGTFNAGTGQVSFVDGGAASSTISGSTLFHNLSLASTSGKTWRFASGSTQRVDGLLVIQGTAGKPIQLASTHPGQPAYLDLLPGGTQSIHAVGVSDIYASGQHLAAGQTNQGGSGGAVGWFDSDTASIQAIPSLSSLGLALLSCLLSAAALLQRRRGKIVRQKINR